MTISLWRVGTITDEVIRAYIDEREGETIHDDSRFPIDSWFEIPSASAEVAV